MRLLELTGCCVKGCIDASSRRNTCMYESWTGFFLHLEPCLLTHIVGFSEFYAWWHYRYKNVPLEKYPRQHRLRDTLRSKGVGRHISEEAIRLLEKMLCLDPKRRITAAEAVMVGFVQTVVWGLVDMLPPFCLKAFTTSWPLIKKTIAT